MKSVSSNIRDFASTFPTLQETRHLADYHPSVSFEKSDVLSLIDAAEVSMKAFDEAGADERANILALLMVGTRS